MRDVLNVGSVETNFEEVGSHDPGEFKHTSSVFWEIRADTQQVLSDCVNHDLRHLDFNFLRDIVQQQEVPVEPVKNEDRYGEEDEQKEEEDGEGEGANCQDEVVPIMRRMPDPANKAIEFVEQNF